MTMDYSGSPLPPIFFRNCYERYFVRHSSSRVPSQYAATLSVCTPTTDTARISDTRRPPPVSTDHKYSAHLSLFAGLELVANGEIKLSLFLPSECPSVLIFH